MKQIKDILKNKKLSNFVNAVDFNYFDDLGEKLKEKYDNNVPFKHIVIDNFLEPKLCEYFLEKIPDRNHDFWKNSINSDRINQPNKLGMFHIKNLYNYDAELALMFQIFNSFVIINFLQKLTGFRSLLADPTFSGGGYHQILRNGKLKIHADFNWHENLKSYRKINLLLYLNKNWKDEYEGNLELWDKNMQKPIKSIKPIFNRCVIFNTGKYSFHGHPIPLKCPEKMSRKSIATYYYESTPNSDDTSQHSTLWKETRN